MTLNRVLVVALLISIIGCNGKKEKVLTEKVATTFEFGVWISANNKKSDKDYSEEFIKYKNAGIDEVLINTGTDPVLLKTHRGLSACMITSVCSICGRS